MVKGSTTPYRQRKANDHQAFELAGNRVNIGDRRTGGVHIVTSLVRHGILGDGAGRRDPRWRDAAVSLRASHDLRAQPRSVLRLCARPHPEAARASDPASLAPHPATRPARWQGLAARDSAYQRIPHETCVHLTGARQPHHCRQGASALPIRERRSFRH